MDVKLTPWTQDGIAGCYLREQNSSGDPTGPLYKMEGANSFDAQRNVTERSLPGDNTTYMKNTKFQDYGLNFNFYGLIPDMLDCFISGIKSEDGDTFTFDETVTGVPKKIVLYQVSDAIGKNGETGQTLETFWDCQVQNLTNPKTSGELVTWQSVITGLAKERNGILTPRQWKFVKGGVALVTGGDTTPPTVVSTTPAQGASNVPLDSNITMVFSKSMSVESLAHVVLEKLSDGTEHALGVPAYTETGGPPADTFTAVWNPPADFSASSQYLVTAKSGKVKDAIGNYLVGDVHRTFTTAAS